MIEYKKSSGKKTKTTFFKNRMLKKIFKKTFEKFLTSNNKNVKL